MRATLSTPRTGSHERYHPRNVISVIVPVRGEPAPPEGLLSRLAETRDAELVVTATPATPAATLEAYAAAGARVRICDGPRGARLRDAAAEAKGDTLLFLHADTVPPQGWGALVTRALDSGALAGAFRLGFAGGGARMSWVAFWANLRTRVTRVPYGDQAPFVRRDVYERIGGHRPWPLLEDVDLGRRLRVEGRIAILDAAVLTSPRRYLERGVARTVLGNWRTLWRFRRGLATPEELAEEYRK